MVSGYLVMDFDSTFVAAEALDELARIALRDAPDREARVAEIERITVAGMEGRISFDESLSARLAMFAPRAEHLTELVRLLHARVTPSVRAYREWFEENAERIYIVSGGFREYIVPVVREFGIAADHVLANSFVRGADGAVTGCDPANPLSRDGGKVAALRELDLDGPVVMVGDGYSDLQTREAGVADEFVAFTENVDRAAITDKADVVAKNFGEVMELTAVMVASGH